MIFELTDPIRGQTMILCHAAVPNEVLYRTRNPERADELLGILEEMWDRGTLARALKRDLGPAPVFAVETMPDGYAVTHRAAVPLPHTLYSTKCAADAELALSAVRRMATIAAMNAAAPIQSQ